MRDNDEFEYMEEDLDGDLVIPYEGYDFLTIRKDGKALCRTLREARKAFADANGIWFETEECSNEDPCAGTCIKCDDELEYLIRETNKIPTEERVYPRLDVNPFKSQKEEHISLDDYLLVGRP